MPRTRSRVRYRSDSRIGAQPFRSLLMSVAITNHVPRNGVKWIAVRVCLLLFGSVRPDFGFGLRVLEGSKFVCDAAVDDRCLAAILEASEVRPAEPGEGATETLASFECGVVDDVDEALIVGRAFSVAGEISQVAAGGKDRGDAGNGCDLWCVLHSIDRLDHLDEHHVLVDGVAIAAGNAAPHFGFEGLATSETALAKGRKHGPVARGNSLGSRADRRN